MHGIFSVLRLLIVLVPATSTFITSESLGDEKRKESSSIAYPKVDAFLGEKLQENEAEIAAKISKIITTTLRKKYRPGNLRRDAHPKEHGCLRAVFKIEQSLNKKFTKGVFVPGNSYQAWIRFSNGNEDPDRPDSEGDGRGMAIKLLGVEGETLLEADRNAGTQDFIMISHPVFLINDASDYLNLIEYVNSENSIVRFLRPLLIPTALGIKGTVIATRTTSKKIDNPLKARYWSMVPYQLGTGPDREAIKFSARPCSPHTHRVPDKPDKDFLRHAMQETLSAGDACMEFLVQPRTSPSLSVEDSQTEWPEPKAPFYKVARIHIPRQSFDTPERNKFCENLSFNPWHALLAHRPLGAVNRMRKVIYEHVSAFRHKMNDTPQREPSLYDPDS